MKSFICFDSIDYLPCCSVTLDVCNYREFFFSIDHEKKIMFNYLKFIKISEKNPVLNWKY